MSEDNQITVNKQALESLITNSAVANRQLLQNKLNGYSGQKHNVYDSAGYPETISFEEYWRMYTRGGLANRVIEAFTDSTWVKDPIAKEITDNNAKETDFDTSIKTMNDDLKLWAEMQRFDVLSGVGQYGGLVIGFDDGLAMNMPVTNARNVIFLRPVPEKFLVPNKINIDTSSPRYGKPETYYVESDSRALSEVHWTRVIHFTWKKLESDFYGVPTLESVFNHILDLEKVNAASGEGFWKGAYPGISVVADKDTNFDKGDADAVKKQMTEYEDNLRRNLTMKGVTVNQLRTVVASSKDEIDGRITQIAGTKGIPKRILIGNEQGELASSQDENNWKSKIQNRQNTLIIPMMIESFIDRLILVGVLPKVKYTVLFPDLYAPSEKEILTNSKLLMEVINAYIDGDAISVLPMVEFLMQIMGYDREAAEKIEAQYANMIKEEEEDEEEEDDIDTNSIFDKIINNTLRRKKK